MTARQPDQIAGVLRPTRGSPFSEGVMQEVHKIAKCWFYMAAAACLVFWSIACTSAQGDDSFITKIQNADEILLVTPETAVNVKGGESFQVKIDKVIRGKSKATTSLRIIQSGDAEKHPKFEAKQQYLFFLKKPAEVTGGWIYTGLETFPLKGGKLEVALEPEKTTELTISDLAKLVADNPPSVDHVEERKNLTGKWFVVISRNGSDLWMWLVDVGNIPADGGPTEVRLVAADQQASASTLASSKVTGNTISLNFNADGQMFHFEGTLANGTVKGSMSATGLGLFPARLIATNNNTLEGYGEARDSIGKDDFMEAVGKEKPEALREFIAKYSGNSMALDAYTVLAAMMATAKTPQAEYEKFAADYQKAAAGWGATLQTRADLDLGVNLLRHNHLSELGLKYLDAAEQKFTSTTPEFLKRITQKERGRGLLAVGKTSDGVALLEKIHTAAPFDAEVTYLLAGQAENSKNTESAMSLYAELAALPSLEPQLAQTFRSRGEKDFKDLLPSSKLKKLWEAKHGNTKELEKFLTQVADNSIRKLAKATVPPRKAGEGLRVSLLELFTGGSCPPCVAADVGIMALESTYQPSELIVLRYHEHIPQADPLANAFTAARMQQYQAQGTPAIFLNGKQYPMGGPLELAPIVYETLRRDIDPILAEKVDLKIQLTAKAEPGRVQITANAEGLKPSQSKVHLMLVIAENRIEFPSNNGIRVHDMVVRAIPSTVGGIAPKSSKISVSFPFNINGLRKVLAQHLDEVEKGEGQAFRGKPLDLKGLKLVGFLQNQENGEVLQAAVISLPAELPVAENGGTAADQPGKGAAVPAKSSPAKSADGK